MLFKKARERRRFEKFYSNNIDKIFRFVFFRVGDRAKAEDLTAEIFMKALEHFGTYDPAKSTTSWLMTITKNHLANYWRDTKPMVSVDAWLEGDGAEEAYLFGAAQGQQKRDEDYRILKELLAKLRDDERELVTLHYLVGYNYTEIAELTGQSEGALRVTVHRIIKKLRRQL